MNVGSLLKTAENNSNVTLWVYQARPDGSQEIDYTKSFSPFYLRPGEIVLVFKDRAAIQGNMFVDVFAPSISKRGMIHLHFLTDLEGNRLCESEHAE